MKTFILYKHTCPNGKCYIGITSHKNPNQRWRNGTAYMPKDHNTKWSSAIIKYGWENITHEILFDNLTKEEACQLEKDYIKQYKDKNLSYNMTDGGDGINSYKFTVEQRQRLSEAHKNIKQSKETIQKRVLKNIGQKRTIETKMKRSMPVIQYTLDGTYVNEFFGLREASRQTNIKHIGCVCNGHRKSAGGYLWKYKKDVNEKIMEPKYRIDYDYETWRTDKEYWINKFEEIKHSFDWKCPTQETLLKMQYELHRWQMYVNIAFNIKDTEAITVSFDYDTNTLHINLNEELIKTFY